MQESKSSHEIAYIGQGDADKALTLTAEIYMNEILQEYAVLYSCDIFLLLRGNARPHTAAAARMLQRIGEYTFSTYTLKSLDMNFIEHIWNMLKGMAELSHMLRRLTGNRLAC